MWTIYALIDPRTNEIRYVGQTQNHPMQRLSDHESSSTPKITNWLRELKQLGDKPRVVVLEYATSQDETLEAEGFWIRCGRRSGWPLLNQTAGRYGSRRRMRQRSPGLTEVVSVSKAAPLPSTPSKLELSVWEYRDRYPTATQAEMRSSFAASSITISRSFMHRCFHNWSRERLAQFERGELSEAQVQALFAAGLLDVNGEPVPGAQQINRE